MTKVTKKYLKRGVYKCPNCNEEKATSEFYKIPDWCKDCRRKDEDKKRDKLKQEEEFIYFILSLNRHGNRILEDVLYVGSGYSRHRAKEQFTNREHIKSIEYADCNVYKLKYANVKKFVNNRQERLFIEYYFINKEFPFFNDKMICDFSSISESRQKELVDLIEQNKIDFKYKDIKMIEKDGELVFNIKDLVMN